jgi:peroxiredoxin
MTVRSKHATALVALVLVALPLVTLAQDDEPAWRADYDKLLDRFSEAGGDRIDAALMLFEKALKEKPDDSLARLELARVRAARDEYDQAQVEARKAMGGAKELEPRAEALVCLATYLGGRQKVEKAPEEQRAKAEEDFAAAFRAAKQKLASVVGGPGEADALFLTEEARYQRLRELALVGQPAPPISKPDLQGKPVDLAEHRGHVVLVLFWRSTSKECVDALPVVAEVVKKFEPRGLVAFGVASDRDLKATELTKTIAKNSIAWRQVHDPKSELTNLDAKNTWRLRAPEPVVCLVDREGVIRFASKPSPDGLAATIEKLLEKKR